MSIYKTRVTQVTLLPIDEQIYSESATTISIDSESCGEFVVVEQSGRSDISKIAISPEEWPELREAIDRMIAECKDEE